jgi:hypothetical protein
MWGEVHNFWYYIIGYIIFSPWLFLEMAIGYILMKLDCLEVCFKPEGPCVRHGFQFLKLVDK